MRSQSSEPVDLPVLTTLRFFAALMIFAYHTREFHSYAWIRPLQPGLYHGVSFFFVLSGFVLTHAYSRRDVHWRDFFLARVARIAPTHLVVMAALALLPLPFARAGDLGPAAAAAAFVWKAAMLEAWTPVPYALFSWNTVSWSLSVEMAFYAAFPLLLAAMRRRPALTLAGAGVLALAVVDLAALAGLPMLASDNAAFTLVHFASAFPLARGFEFTLGVGACLVWRRRVAPARLSAFRWTLVEGAAFAGAVVWLLAAAPALVHAAHGPLGAILRASGSCVLFALLIVALAKGQGALGRALAWRPLTVLGQASFAFYLVHFAILRALAELAPQAGALPALALSLSLAVLLHYRVEVPARRRLLGAFRKPGSRELATAGRAL